MYNVATVTFEVSSLHGRTVLAVLTIIVILEVSVVLMLMSILVLLLMMA